MDSTANPAHLPQNWAELAKSAVLFSWFPGFGLFSIAMGADYSYYMKSIATCALTFFGYVISVLVSVKYLSSYIKAM